MIPGGEEPVDTRGDVVDAASVLLLREHAGRVEVFVVERHPSGAFAGVLAYPGGKVDPADRDLPDELHTGLDLEAVTRRWGLDPARAVDRARVKGWYVAAVREAFEEVGLLLALRRDDDGGLVPLEPEGIGAQELAAARGRLTRRGVSWDWTSWLRAQSLVLDLGRLHPWSRWITPVGEPRRFDTMFLVATVPDAQFEALAHDQVEVVAARWLTPAAILAEREQGRSVVIYPTRRQLPGVPDSLAELASVLGERDLRAVQPTITTDDDGTIVARHPHDGTVEGVF